MADLAIEAVEVFDDRCEVRSPRIGPTSSGVGFDLHGVEARRLFAAAHGDLAIGEATGSSSDGWRIEIPAVLLEPTFRLTVFAVDRSGAARPIAAASGRCERYSDLGSVRPQPILVHQLGRAGSTLAMRLLTGHPDVTGFTGYPLENRLGLAWAHALGVLLGEQTVGPAEAAFFDARRVATANPYAARRYLGDDLAAAVDRGPHDAIRSAVVDTVSATYAGLDPHATHWAEKFRHESPGACITQQVVLATWPNARQVLLIRDPRDLLCSRLSFNQLRGSGSFDLDLDDDASSGVPSIVGAVRIVARQALAFPEAAVVRYEDLARRPTATATRLFRELGLPHGFGPVRQAVDATTAAESDGHRTSASAEASIGRWREELPPAIAERLCDELAVELAMFGYDE